MDISNLLIFHIEPFPITYKLKFIIPNISLGCSGSSLVSTKTMSRMVACYKILLVLNIIENFNKYKLYRTEQSSSSVEQLSGKMTG